MIPHEAIKAATKAFIEHGTLIPALEAAAPHMQVDAPSREDDPRNEVWH